MLARLSLIALSAFAILSRGAHAAPPASGAAAVHKKEPLAVVFVAGAMVPSASYSPVLDLLRTNLAIYYDLSVVLIEAPIPPVAGMLNQTISRALDKLAKGGFQGDLVHSVVLMGHSLGGQTLNDLKRPCKGLVLLAATVMHPIDEFPSPVLQLGGDLDALWPMTKFAMSWKTLLDGKGMDWTIRNAPVVLLPNVTHSQFCSKFQHKNAFLTDNVPYGQTHAQAHAQIARVLFGFILTLKSTLGPAADTVGAATMKYYLAQSKRLMDPFLEALDRDQHWCRVAQAKIINDDSTFERLRIENSVYNDRVGFVASKPHTYPAKADWNATQPSVGPDGRVTISTLIVNPPFKNVNPLSSDASSYVHCKCISQAGVKRAFKITRNFAPAANCQTIMRGAFALAESLLTRPQLARYKAIGRPQWRVSAHPDTQLNTGMSWVAAGFNETLTTEGSREYREFTSPSLLTPLSFPIPIFPTGTQYCKFLSISAIVQHMLLEGLRGTLRVK